MGERLQIFISYSHRDEWLKDEFIRAMSAARRSGQATIWHDRMLRPGSSMDDSIDAAIESSQFMVLLLSADFINSNYCMNIEFKRALELRRDGKLEVIPIVVRDCDWKIHPLDGIIALPTDGTPVNPKDATRDSSELRDGAWASVARTIREMMGTIEILPTSVGLKESYEAFRTKKWELTHNRVPNIDLKDVLVGPPLSNSVNEFTIKNLDDVIDVIEDGQPILLSGDDQSGKSAVLYLVQQRLCDRGVPAVIVGGRDLRNKDLASAVRKEISQQLKQAPDDAKLVVLIDDLDECRLPEGIQQKMLGDAVRKYRSLGATSYSQLHSCLFVGADMPELVSVTINEFTGALIYDLVQKWVTLGEDDVDAMALEVQVRNAFRVVMAVVNGGSGLKTPGMILGLLKVLDASQGTDLAITSNAACYDALTTMQIAKAGVAAGRVDLYKNYIGFLAMELWGRSGSQRVSKELLRSVAKRVEEQFLVELKDVGDILTKAKVLIDVDGEYEFPSKTMIYFFAGRHLAKYARDRDPELYTLGVDECISKIALRSHANTVLYCLYFNNDLGVLNKLIAETDTLFAEASSWRLGKAFDRLTSVETPIEDLTQRTGDHRSERLALLAEPYRDVVKREERLAEHYLSPFSEISVNLEESAETPEGGLAYLDSMNALFRLQSVLTSALKTRSGTFERDAIVRTVESVVAASGRFAHFNLMLAAQLMVDSSATIEDMRDLVTEEAKDIDAAVGTQKHEQQLQRLMLARFDRYIQFLTKWSLVVSQGVIGRMLSDGGTIKALTLLHEEKELDGSKQLASGDFYNFGAALCVAKMWADGEIDRAWFDKMLDKYGTQGRFYEILRMSMYVFSRHMPIAVQERQWLHTRLSIEIGGTRVRQRNVKALPDGKPGA